MVHGQKEPGFTAHAFKGMEAKETGGNKIDFMFAKGEVIVNSADIIKDHKENLYPSDLFLFRRILSSKR